MGTFYKDDFAGTVFEPLLELSDCPRQIYTQGALLPRDTIRFVTVVGSRKPSSYARQALAYIIRGLEGHSVCIVSGLALGIDVWAHTLALEHRLVTMALPGSGLSEKVLYPASNRHMARRIVESGGALVSECTADTRAAPWTFPKRNRLMARLADLVLVVEAGEKSGTLITARNAAEYSVDVAVIPGSIFNEGARGSNGLLQQGAQVVTHADDILDLLGMSKVRKTLKEYVDINEQEQTLLSLLIEPLSRDELAERAAFDAVSLATTISLLEIKGYVREELGRIYKC